MRRLYPFILELIKKHGTNNPYEIASILDISIVYKDLTGLPSGLFLRYNKKSIIIVHSKLKKSKRDIVIAHELGHYLLKHHGNRIWGYRGKPTGETYELQANKFAFLLAAHTVLRNESVIIGSIQGERTLSDSKLLDLLEYIYNHDDLQKGVFS